MLSEGFSVQILYNHTYEEGLSSTRRKEGREEAWVVMVKRLLLTPHSPRWKAETLLWEPTFPPRRFHRRTRPSDSESQLSSRLCLICRPTTEGQGRGSASWRVRQRNSVDKARRLGVVFFHYSEHTLKHNANCRRSIASPDFIIRHLKGSWMILPSLPVQCLWEVHLPAAS